MKQLIVLALVFFVKVDSIMFRLYGTEKKCLGEHVSKDALVSGTYNVSHLPLSKVELKVFDSKMQILYQVPDVKSGKFSFVTEHDETVHICFLSEAREYDSDRWHEIELNVKKGVEAKNYNELGEAQKLKPIETEMMAMEDMARSIVQEFENMKTREEAMSNTNESTSNRIFYLSIFNFVWLISVTALQVIYLRKFFRSKKLIE